MQFIVRNPRRVILSLGLCAIVLSAVIPFRGLIIDVLIALALPLTISILARANRVRTLEHFFAFPTTLFEAALYCLLLNLAVLSMIVTKGIGSDEILIRTISARLFINDTNEYLQAISICAIPLIVQMVLAVGSSRISAVAARFALDSLPGRQLAIDSDLAHEVINIEEARTLRGLLMKRMLAYGAMDGAAHLLTRATMFALILIPTGIGGLAIAGHVLKDDAFIAMTGFIGVASFLGAIPAIILILSAGTAITKFVEHDV